MDKEKAKDPKTARLVVKLVDHLFKKHDSHLPSILGEIEAVKIMVIKAWEAQRVPAFLGVNKQQHLTDMIDKVLKEDPDIDPADNL